MTIPLNQYTRGWYMFWAPQVAPLATGAPFLEPGLKFWVQKSKFSDFLGVLRVRMGPHMSPNIGPYPRHHLQSLFATIFRDIILSHISPPYFQVWISGGPGATIRGFLIGMAIFKMRSFDYWMKEGVRFVDKISFINAQLYKCKCLSVHLSVSPSVHHAYLLKPSKPYNY